MGPITKRQERTQLVGGTLCTLQCGVGWGGQHDRDHGRLSLSLADLPWLASGAHGFEVLAATCLKRFAHARRQQLPRRSSLVHHLPTRHRHHHHHHHHQEEEEEAENG